MVKKIKFSYLQGALLLIVLLTISRSQFLPLTSWILGYAIIFITAREKDPLDARAWVFCAWGILFVNYFCGILYIPPTIEFLFPISYILLVLCMFFIGYKRGTRDKAVDKADKILSTFLSFKANPKLQKLMFMLGILACIGVAFAYIELIVIRGYSLDGGLRRDEFHNDLESSDVNYKFSPLLIFGNIFLGGAFISALSTFFWGNKRNKITGIFAIASVALYSVLIAGKQGIFIGLLTVIFALVLKNYYKVKVKLPVVAKLLIIIGSVCAFSYLLDLTNSRGGNIDFGDKLNQDNVSESFAEMGGKYIPVKLQNIFLDYVGGYYGNQIGCFSERWELDNYPEKYFIRVPRLLGPFVWVERQIAKVFPLYYDIFDDNYSPAIARNQTNGYYGLATWQTTIRSGISWYGLFGQLIVVFFHGFYSRRLYEHIKKKPSFVSVHLCLLNSIALVYTIMMNFFGETCGTFALLILLILTWKEYSARREGRSFTLLQMQ